MQFFEKLHFFISRFVQKLLVLLFSFWRIKRPMGLVYFCLGSVYKSLSFARMSPLIANPWIDTLKNNFFPHRKFSTKEILK